ncbi:hypothetical protein PMAYCL1PPCAC_09322, partial [Pristionchus mayeri]
LLLGSFLLAAALASPLQVENEDVNIAPEKNLDAAREKVVIYARNSISIASDMVAIMELFVHINESAITDVEKSRFNSTVKVRVLRVDSFLSETIHNLFSYN